MTPRMDYSIPLQGHIVDGGASPPNEVRVVGECGRVNDYECITVGVVYLIM